MIKEIPHMLESFVPLDRNGSYKMECTCGAVWLRKRGEETFEFKLDEGNALCSLPTLYHRWQEMQEIMRRFSLAAT